MRERKTQYVMREKEVLMMVNHPFFVRLHYTFQDSDRLCILDTVMCMMVRRKSAILLENILFAYLKTEVQISCQVNAQLISAFVFAK